MEPGDPILPQAQELQLLRQERESFERELQGWSRITGVIGQARNPEEAIDAIFHHLMEAYGVEYCWLRVLDNAAENLTTYQFSSNAYRDFPAESIDALVRLAIPRAESSSLWRAIEKRRPVFMFSFDPAQAAIVEQEILKHITIRSFIQCPIYVADEALGVLSFVNVKRKMRLARDEVHSLFRFTSQIGGLIRSSILQREILAARAEADKERARAESLLKEISADLMEASRIQRSVFSQAGSAAPLAGVETLVHYDPLALVGGDLYDIAQRDDSVRIFIADATGHGIQAALLTMAIKAEYENLKHEGTPATLLQNLNSRFHSKYSVRGSFASAMVLDIYPRQKKLIYASAGHPAQYVLSGGKVVELSHAGRLVGIDGNAKLRDVEIDLGPTSRILLFTDGLFEQTNSSDEAFGEERVIQIMSKFAERPPIEFLSELLAEHAAFHGPAVRSDDLTAIVVDVV